MVEEKSLKITGANKTFFNKLTTTLNKFLIPTRVGLNGLLISAKRNNLIKAYVDVFFVIFSAVFEDGINRFFYDAHVDEAWIGIRFYISRKPDGVNFSDKKWINFLLREDI